MCLFCQTVGLFGAILLDLVWYFCWLGSPSLWGLCENDNLLMVNWSYVCVWVRLNTCRGGRSWVIFTIVVLYFCLHLSWRVLSLIWVNVSPDLSASCANQIFVIFSQILFCIGCGYTVVYCLEWVLTWIDSEGEDFIIKVYPRVSLFPFLSSWVYSLTSVIVILDLYFSSLFVNIVYIIIIFSLHIRMYFSL